MTSHWRGWATWASWWTIWRIRNTSSARISSILSRLAAQDASATITRFTILLRPVVNAVWECINFAKRWKASAKDASTFAKLSRKRARHTSVPSASVEIKRDCSFNLALRKENRSMFILSAYLSISNGRLRTKLSFKTLLRNFPLLPYVSIVRRKPLIIFNAPAATSVFMACVPSYKDVLLSLLTQEKLLSHAATTRLTKIVFHMRESSS